ncbi:MAG: homogentisate 1,2-dioxygenase, partial [Chlorobi bacterium]|nr:homogentisate 1,2-dioxygenase [Chlorobiota bacterium]
MPFYHKLGKIPQKRHVQFRQPDGSLYKEEVVGTEGFSGISSILYHINPPTKVKEIKKVEDFGYQEWAEGTLRHHHLKTLDAKSEGDPVSGRKV